MPELPTLEQAIAGDRAAEVFFGSGVVRLLQALTHGEDRESATVEALRDEVQRLRAQRDEWATAYRACAGTSSYNIMRARIEGS